MRVQHYVCDILLGSKNYYLLHQYDVLKVLVLLMLFFTVWFPMTAGHHLLISIVCNTFVF